MQIIKYLKEVRDELGKVSWPTRQNSTRMTLVVLGASLLVGFYIGTLDLSLTSLLGLFIK